MRKATNIMSLEDYLEKYPLDEAARKRVDAHKAKLMQLQTEYGDRLTTINETYK